MFLFLNERFRLAYAIGLLLPPIFRGGVWRVPTFAVVVLFFGWDFVFVMLGQTGGALAHVVGILVGVTFASFFAIFRHSESTLSVQRAGSRAAARSTQARLEAISGLARQSIERGYFT